MIRIYGTEGYEEWSIDFICPDFEKTNLIKFTFLVNAAPYKLLEKNREYNLYEGNRKIAKLEIIG